MRNLAVSELRFVFLLALTYQDVLSVNISRERDDNIALLIFFGFN